MTSSPSRRLLWVVCVVASTALAAGCGSSSSSSSSPAASGSTLPSATTSPPSSSSSGGGVSSSSFCDTVRRWKAEQPKEIQSLKSLQSGATLKSVYSKLNQAYSQVLAIAPSEIKPDVQVLYSDFQKIQGILAKHNYNLLQSSADLQAHQSLFQNAQTKQAIARLNAWGKANSCHL